MKLCGIILIIVGLTFGVREYFLKRARATSFYPDSHGEVIDPRDGIRRANLALWGAVSLGGFVLLGVGKLRERLTPQ